MKAKVYVLPLWGFNTTTRDSFESGSGKIKVVTTVSKEKSWCAGLSPFLIGPCKLYGRYRSLNMENGWQYSKVYKEHCDSRGPTGDYFSWAIGGWAMSRANRYPMGKGRKPEYSWWDGRKLDYVAARKAIYGPLYAEAVQQTMAWERLQELYKAHDVLILLDYDAYDHRGLGMTLTDVLNNPKKKMGHAFVLSMLLTRDKALKQMELRS